MGTYHIRAHMFKRWASSLVSQVHRWAASPVHAGRILSGWHVHMLSILPYSQVHMAGILSGSHVHNVSTRSCSHGKHHLWLICFHCESHLLFAWEASSLAQMVTLQALCLVQLGPSCLITCSHGASSHVHKAMSTSGNNLLYNVFASSHIKHHPLWHSYTERHHMHMLSIISCSHVHTVSITSCLHFHMVTSIAWTDAQGGQHLLITCPAAQHVLQKQLHIPLSFRLRELICREIPTDL